MISVTREPYAIGGERHDDGGFIHVQTVAGRNGDDAALAPEAMGACQAIDGTGVICGVQRDGFALLENGACAGSRRAHACLATKLVRVRLLPTLVSVWA